MLEILYKKIYELLKTLDVDVYNMYKINSLVFPYISYSLYTTVVNNEYGNENFTLTIDVFDKNTDNLRIIQLVDNVSKTLNNYKLSEQKYFLQITKISNQEVPDTAENVRHFVMRFKIKTISVD